MIDRLIAAGKAAQAIRCAPGFRYENKSLRRLYEKAIGDIDAIVDEMKAKRPADYWRDEDPAYQHLKEAWQLARIARGVESKPDQEIEWDK